MSIPEYVPSPVSLAILKMWKGKWPQVTREYLFQFCSPVPWVNTILNLGLGFLLPRMGIIIAVHVQFTSKDTHVKTHVNHSTGYDISEATLLSFPPIVQLDCPLVTFYNSKRNSPAEDLVHQYWVAKRVDWRITLKVYKVILAHLDWGSRPGPTPELWLAHLSIPLAL